jgi:hypothetical protein
MERGRENGAPEEEGRASQGAGSGGDVESRKEHGRSLWPTAKRFSSPPTKAQSSRRRLRLSQGEIGVFPGRTDLPET